MSTFKYLDNLITKEDDRQLEVIVTKKELTTERMHNKSRKFLDDVVPSRKFGMLNTKMYKYITKADKECPSALFVLYVHICNSKNNESKLSYSDLQDITGLSRDTVCRCQKWLYANNLLFRYDNIYYINPNFFWNTNKAYINMLPETVVEHFNVKFDNNNRRFDSYIQIDMHKSTKEFLINLAKEKVNAFNMYLYLSLSMIYGSVKKTVKRLTEVFKCSISKIKYLLKFLNEKEVINTVRNESNSERKCRKEHKVNFALSWNINKERAWLFVSDVAGRIANYKKSAALYNTTK